MPSRRVISMKTFSPGSPSHQYIDFSAGVWAMGAASIAAKWAASPGR